MKSFYKARQRWSEEENLQLKKLIEKNGMTRKGWKKTSLGMISRGFQRSTKACRERFHHHFDRNQSELTKEELSQLFSLINVHGNKWSVIAQNIKGRKDLEIKNSFYSNVKRICRRLIKAAYGTTASTQKTEQIRPVFISNIFCNEHHLKFNIDSDIKKAFQELIFENQEIKQGAKVNLQTTSKVKFVMEYFCKEKWNYEEKKKEKKGKKEKIEKKEKKKKKGFLNKINLFYDSSSTPYSNTSDTLLMKIQQRQPIFTTTTYPIDKYYQIYDPTIWQHSYNISTNPDQCLEQQQQQIVSYQDPSQFIVQSNQQNQYDHYLYSFYSTSY